MSKNIDWIQWYESLNEHTRKWFDAQPTWHDRHLAYFFVFGLFTGGVIGCWLGTLI